MRTVPVPLRTFANSEHPARIFFVTDAGTDGGGQLLADP
jgi:hypothetical protein